MKKVLSLGVLLAITVLDIQNSNSQLIEKNSKTFEEIAFYFVKDSLLAEKRLVFDYDSAYYLLGLEEEYNQLMSFDDCIVTSCSGRLSSNIFFPYDFEGENRNDSIKKLAEGFILDYSEKKSKTLKNVAIAGFSNERLDEKTAEDQTAYFTVSGKLESNDIVQVEVIVCKKIQRMYKQFHFNVFMGESRRVLDWYLRESYFFGDLGDCETCFFNPTD